jgi:predicted DNA-binding transcriptional regulator AlpA
MTTTPTSPRHLSTTARLLTANEVAAELGVSRRTIWRWCEQGLFVQPIRRGRK